MRVLEVNDVIDLLRTEVRKVGSVTEWAKKARIDRTMVSYVVNGRRPPTKKIIRALNLRMVFVARGKIK